MNNLLKYRVWDKRGGRYMSESYFALLGNGKLIISYGGYYSEFTNTNVDDYIIERYSGLNDRNGVEIYEGDIIEYSRLFEKERVIKKLKSYIRFDSGKYGFDLIGFNNMFYDLGDEWNISVVGNINEDGMDFIK